MFRTDILFTGFYSHQNTGDDAFVEVTAWGAKKFWNKDNSRFLGRESKLPKTIVSSKGYPFDIKGTYGLQASVLLNNTNAFIFAGGSTIHSKLSQDNIRMKAFKRKLSGNGPMIGGIGVSVGPFKSSEDEHAVREYVKQMDFLAVRDQASFDYLSSIDLPYQPVNAFDLAALLPEIYNYTTLEEISAEKRIIGISVCPYESIQQGLDMKNEVKRNKMLVDLLKEIDRHGNIHFRFYIINGHDRIGDRNLTLETIAKVVPKSYDVIEYSPSTQSIWKSIADCDFVISTRLHAAIFACFAGTPFMLNEYHRKCSDFLYNIGYNEQYRLYDSNYDVKDKAKQIVDIIFGGWYSEPQNLQLMKERARLNFTQIKI